MVKYIENWLHSRAQRVVIIGMRHSWRSPISNVSQGSIMGAIPFHVLINGLDDGAKCTLSKFTSHENLGGEDDMPQVCAAI